MHVNQGWSLVTVLHVAHGTLCLGDKMCAWPQLVCGMDPCDSAKAPDTSAQHIRPQWDSLNTRGQLTF